MPPLDQSVLNCSFYLYPSEETAEAGATLGGSGFVVVVSEHYGKRGLLYAVTAGHVIGQANTLRFNRKNGPPYFVTIPEHRWHRSLTHDIAATSLFGVPSEELEIFLMPLGLGLTRERAIEEGITVGDDVFIVGRFLGHDGRERNLPTARFGNIAMMPLQPIENRITGLAQESFLVEVRSVSGYSGSPVFMYREKAFGPSTRLLGTVWGHIEHFRDNPHGFQSGMVGVTPSWALIDLLYDADVMTERGHLLPGFDEDWIREVTESQP
jgi:hypothetical protein